MLSDRDKDRLAGCHPDLVSKVDQLFDSMATDGHPMFVIEGLRTAVRQNFHFNKGRTTIGPDPTAARPFGKTVTECDGYTKKSNHQAKADGFGHAADLGFQGAETFGNAELWAKVGTCAEALGLKWGGRFPKVDLDHVELP